MTLTQSTELLNFFNTYCMESDLSDDPRNFKKFLADIQPSSRVKTLESLQSAIQFLPSLEDLGSLANRWFASEEEALAWLSELRDIALEIQASEDNTSSDTNEVVKDSNGAVLTEGDSVTVIQDLKVKGGSSDLKRGTQIRKIHLINDPEAVECRVDGSVLVLKTKFLRKN